MKRNRIAIASILLTSVGCWFWLIGPMGQGYLAAQISPINVSAEPASSLTAGQANKKWKSILAEKLPVLGHRNWIVIADSAYPLQTAPGIKTIYAGGDHLQTVTEVLKMVEEAQHVRGIIHVDRELEFVPGQFADGIGNFRSELKKVLNNKNTKQLNHEEIIAKLDEAGQTFEVLIIKTDLTLPYTSVFILLDAGYWSAEAEEALRKSMQGAK